MYSSGGMLKVEHCRGTLSVQAVGLEGLRESAERMERRAAEELRRAAIVRAAIPMVEQAEGERERAAEEEKRRKLVWRQEQRLEKKRRDEGGFA